MNVANTRPREIVTLDNRIRSCRLCEEAGHIPSARPVVMDGGRFGGIVLIGQAPGIVEHESGRPFGGRAGRELFRWLESIGIEEDDFRTLVYMAAVTRCFPGKAVSGSGDRKPSRLEIEACRPWLEAVLATLRPRSLLLVGQLAMMPYFAGRRLDDVIGRRFEFDGRTVVPLPHPSGASRWLNDPSHRRLLGEALAQVKDLWNEMISSSTEPSFVQEMPGLAQEPISE